MQSPTSKLNEKWKDFEKTIDREKVLRQANIQKQLSELSTKLGQHTSTNDQAYLQLRERVEELKRQVENIEDTKREVDRSLQDAIVKAEQNFNAEVQNEKEKSKEEIDSWTKQADEKLLSICHSMEDVTNDKGETIQGMTERMTKKLTNLKDTIAYQKKKREQGNAELNQAIEQELTRLHAELDGNRKIREITNKKIAKMAQDIQAKLMHQIDEERKARKQTNKALLTLLEETCAKIQKAFF